MTPSRPAQASPLARPSLAAALLIATACLAAPGTGAQPAAPITAATIASAPAWVSASDAITRQLLRDQATLSPEFASQQGLTEFDGLALDLGPRIHERTDALTQRLLRQLRQRLARETQPPLQQDLQILIDNVQLQQDSARLSARLELAWLDAPEIIFYGLRGLLDEQVAPERRAKALTLLRRYVGLHPGSTPLIRQAQARFDESTQPAAARRIGPVKARVQQSIANTPLLAQGIREMFAKNGITGPELDAALAALERQFTEHSAWQQRRVLPLAREDFRMPPALYAMALRQMGIDIPPQQLIARAQAAYQEIRASMRALAPRVAREKNLGLSEADAANPVAVLRALKRETVPDDQLVPRYQAVNAQLEDIIRRERIVTLPARPMAMRLASAAESAAQPAPSMQPPRLVGNQGERGTFVLPVRNPTAADGQAYDDFNHPAAMWTLSAHEGRPGHELQFSVMVERGVSLARSLYAFNSVNVEGWALYAEAEVLPHQPPEGQLVALQFRLLRAARAMLDPMLNLGLVSQDEAIRVLRDEAGFSAAMVKQEIDRYTLRNPGQAGSYFYGYSRLLQLRTETELALGPRFDRLKFNDFVLGQGLLPVEMLGKAVKRQLLPTNP